METRKLLHRLYPEAVKPRRIARLRARIVGAVVGVARKIRYTRRRIAGWLSRNAFKVALGVLAFAAWAGLHITFYNRLLFLEYDVRGARAQIVAEQQRRFHIAQSLLRVMIAYAQHERAVMTALTELRSKSRPASEPSAKSAQDALADLTNLDPKELKGLLPDVMVIAEQYPALRLSENFQQLTTGIVNTETRITERIQKYNEVCNRYTTELRQFPGIVFGKVWGFKMCEFYDPPEPDAEKWIPIPLGNSVDGPGSSVPPPPPRLTD